MLESLISIMLSALSYFSFEFICYKLNLKFGLFESLRSNIEALNEEKNKKLRITSLIFILVISGIISIIFEIITNINTSYILDDILFILLFSFRNICFKNTLWEWV